MALPFALKLAKVAVGSDADVRCKHDDQVSTRRYMLSERLVADFADEGDATEATHIEATADDPGEAIIQAVRVVVNLVRADTASE